jgi:very-short-patch-repair endonuclease
VQAARLHIKQFGGSIFRLLSSLYRQAMRTLRSVLKAEPPKALTDRLAILDALIAAQNAWRTIQNMSDLGRRAFGTLWRGEDSRWDALSAIESWDAQAVGAAIPPGYRRLVQRIEDRAAVARSAAALLEQIAPTMENADAIFKSVETNLSLAFATPAGSKASTIHDVPLGEMIARLQAWAAQPEAIAKWIAYWTRHRAVIAEGMAELAARLYDGRIAPAAAIDGLHMAYFETLMRRCVQEQPALAAFDGLSHERVLERFRQLDLKRIALARQEVALAHYECVPRGTAQIGEVGVVRQEIAKKRRHLPLRQLLKRAGNAVAAIKPVFMMSPLSIAQYVEPGALEFDLLLIDEASQVRPIDALGAIARVKRIVVVGDDRQLPPTRFFMALMDDADIEHDLEQDEFHAGDIESILGLCAAQGLPQRMLRWHYRSRHHSLIAVSNRQFYDSRLYVVPSPVRGSRESGLVFHHVADGAFDRGNSATNRVEAARVASAVMQHAQRTPEHSLGVGAFSVAQRDAILDELERLRRHNPGCEAFFATGKPEPFFVKNLENIQGDERDVIFISVGYGRDASGYLAMNFGPLSAEGGERRLNVLITRARTRCEVFSSITADDIDLNRATGKGPAAFKAFLSYAKSGVLDIGVAGEGEPDSAFEESVARAITACGFAVDHQVGVAGFFVDLAVKDPDNAGRYLLGIECDGRAYHASRSARDRDRLRQQVLEDRGWTIHRIWSTDWFNRPDDQLRKVLAAIELAKVRPAGRTRTPAPASVEPVAAIVREGGEDEIDDTLLAKPYEQASFAVPLSTEVHEVPLRRMMEIVTRIVRVEGPIHEDEIAARVRGLWNLSRTGARIQKAVMTALEEAIAQGTLLRDSEFISLSGDVEVPLRNRESAASPSLRKPETLPPAEIRRALHALIERHLGVSREQAIVAAARLLGFRSTSATLRETLDRQIDALIAAERITLKNDRLHLVDEEPVA